MAATSMDKSRMVAVAVAADFELKCVRPQTPSAAPEHQMLLSLVEQKCRDGDTGNVITAVPATLLDLTQHSQLRLAATALCALGVLLQEPLPRVPKALLRRGVSSAKIWTAESGIDSLGRALRRPGLMAAAEGLQQHVVSIMAIDLMSVTEDLADDHKPVFKAASKLQPAALGCLRLATQLPAGLDMHPVTAARCAANIAAFAAKEEGLSDGLPLLLQQLGQCQAGLEGDCPVTAVIAAGLRAAADAANGPAAATSTAAAAEDGVRAACSAAPAAGSRAAGAAASGGRAAVAGHRSRPSPWAMPLFLTLQALTRLWATGARITDVSAAAITRALALLAAHEVATKQPLPWTADNVTVQRDADYLAMELLSKLRGGAAVTATRHLLRHLSGGLAAAAADVARVYPAHAAAHGSTCAGAASGMCGAAAPGAAAEAEAPALPPSDAAPVEPQQSAGPAAAARIGSGPVSVATTLASLATCANTATTKCLKDKTLQPLLAPGSEGGQAWATLLGRALATCCFSPGALGEHVQHMPGEDSLSAFEAATQLCQVAAALLLDWATAGLEALQQWAGVQLMDAVTSHLSSEPGVTYKLRHVPDAVVTLRQTRLVLEVAIKAVLRVGEGGRGSGSRKQQQGQQARRQVPLALLEAASTSAIALMRDVQRPTLVAYQHEGPEQAYYTAQDGAKLVTRLLHAFAPLAAYVLATANAAHYLLIKLAMLANKPWDCPQIVTAVAALCEPVALLARQVPEQHWMFAVEGAPDEISWPQLQEKLWQRAQEQPAHKRVLVETAITDVTAAMEDSLRGALSMQSAAEGGSASGRTAADADAAMATLLAEEEGRAPAAAPSKAALKRARKKAAAAAAAAPPRSVGGSSASAVSEHVPAQSGNGAMAEAAAAAPAAGAGIGDGATAAQNGMQELRLQNSPASSVTRPASRSPGWMMCPLTHTVLVDPVLCTGDGQSYERAAITQWLKTSDTSPATGQPLVSRDLLPNHALRSIIQAAQARSA